MPKAGDFPRLRHFCQCGSNVEFEADILRRVGESTLCADVKKPRSKLRLTLVFYISTVCPRRCG